MSLLKTAVKLSLGSFINKLFTIALSEDVQPVAMHEAFKYLHRLSKFRGPKFIVRKFSHEVTDLHLVLALLQQQNKGDREVGLASLPPPPLFN